MDIYIDAHGPDHGLMVAFDGSDVHIADYSEFCEENHETGRWEAVYRETRVDIAELLSPNGKHDFDDHRELTGRERMESVIISAATGWLAYWGVDSDGETIVDIDRDGGACAFFSEYWGDYAEPGDYQICSACQDRRDSQLRSAVTSYAYGSPVDDRS
jgi:hypothetical protein